jgi:hypothetical protein|nr:hypothetical protein [Oxalobacteraceae bacterium]
MPFSPEFIQKWQHIVDSVEVTDVPLECIKKVTIRMYGNRRRTVNLSQLKRAGMDLPAIEDMLNRTFEELGDSVRDVDFMVDVAAVAEIVQPQTDRLLKGIK